MTPSRINYIKKMFICLRKRTNKTIIINKLFLVYKRLKFHFKNNSMI